MTPKPEQDLSLGDGCTFFVSSSPTLHRALQSLVDPMKPAPTIGTNTLYTNIVQQTCNDTGTKTCSIPMTPLGVTYEIAFL